MHRGPQTPKHVAIIMDGNGRWAQQRGHSRVYGHVRGSGRLKAIIEEANRLGVKALTLYAFSTENWARPDSELKILWKLLKKYLQKEAENLYRNNVKFRVIGELERLDSDIQDLVRSVQQRLSGNTGLNLTFAVSYGSRREIARACQLFAQDCLAGKRRPEEMNEQLMNQYLWTSDLDELSEVDLVIRTSGEVRVSNFLLWQAAYAEFYFTDICWPDFNPARFRDALIHFANRERRFGALSLAQNASAFTDTLK